MIKQFYFIKQVLTNLVLIGFFLSGHVFASDVNGIRFWQDPEKTRIVFDLSDDVKYKIFTLSNPSRLVIDIASTSARVGFSMRTTRSVAYS